MLLVPIFRIGGFCYNHVAIRFCLAGVLGIGSIQDFICFSVFTFAEVLLFGLSYESLIASCECQEWECLLIFWDNG